MKVARIVLRWVSRQVARERKRKGGQLAEGSFTFTLFVFVIVFMFIQVFR